MKGKLPQSGLYVWLDLGLYISISSFVAEKIRTFPFPRIFQSLFAIPCNPQRTFYSRRLDILNFRCSMLDRSGGK
jgi:hypothetical protein